MVDVDRGKLRLYISVNEAPFKENERVLVVEEGKLVVKHIDYYIVKPATKPGSYKINPSEN